MIVRAPTLDDAQALAESHVRAWQAGYRHCMPAPYLESFSTEETEKDWLERLRDGGGGFLVCDIDGRAVGFVMFGEPRNEPIVAGSGEVTALNVHPDHWRCGIGKALLTAAFDGLRQAGYPAMFLWVVEPNARARAFYEACGLRCDGLTRLRQLAENVAVDEIRYSMKL